MTAFGTSCKRVGQALVIGLALSLAACSPGEFSLGSRTLSFPGFAPEQPATQPMTAMPQPGMMQPGMPMGPSQSFGRGPVKVALLLPLSGDPGLAGVGTSLANASRLAIDFIDASPTIAENITIVLKDTGTSSGGAAQAASQAAAEGASLILGPLRADQVTAAGSVARAAGVPLIGFSNNAAAASPGVYLLSVLPEAEMKRSLAYVQAQGRRGIAGIFSTNEFGRAQETAFRQMAATLGIAPVAVYSFSNPAEAQSIVSRAMPMMMSGQIDALFIPDRATAPRFGMLLQQAGIDRNRVTLVGSADWEGDPTIRQSPGLAGAYYPAVDESGINALRGEYQAKFGMPPHPLATIAYTATILANVNTLSMATPRYNQTLLTAASGFNGRDGVFRFLGNGRSEYALAMKQVINGATIQVDGARL